MERALCYIAGHTVTSRGSPDMSDGHDTDITQNREMWRNFVRLVSFSVACIVVALALMAFFLT